MKKAAWDEFKKIRERCRKTVHSLLAQAPELGRFQQNLVDTRNGPAYTVETPAVYNEALDELDSRSQIKLILVADNPGRREQAASSRRYLVGPSGKIAEAFFRNTPELGIDFRKNVLILNKTPVHTPRTAELADLCALGGETVVSAVVESQKAMAALLLEFHRALAPVPVWIIGYSEMKKGGVFETYTACIKEQYSRFPRRREEIFFYRHFSMNQFTIDLRQQTLPGEAVEETLRRMGTAYRERVMGKE
jgi:hypothetical protein